MPGDEPLAVGCGQLHLGDTGEAERLRRDAHRVGVEEEAALHDECCGCGGKVNG
jgi:hypothetical protein